MSRDPYDSLEPGQWLTGKPGMELLELSDISDERFKGILDYVEVHINSYAAQGLPRTYSNMSDSADEGAEGAMHDYLGSNEPLQAMGVTRFRSVVREAIRRGWDPTQWFGPLTRRRTDYDVLGGEKDEIEQVGWADELAGWDVYDLDYRAPTTRTASRRVASPK